MFNETGLVLLMDYLYDTTKSYKIPASFVGKKVYTKSCWATIPGLFEATLISTDYTVKVGEELKQKCIEKGYINKSWTQTSLTMKHIYINPAEFKTN